jgi:hypothetical protein
MHGIRYTWHARRIFPVHVAYAAGVTGRRIYLMYRTL